MQNILNKLRIILLLVILIGWILVYTGSGLITEWIWFQHLGFAAIFTKIISAKLIIHGTVFILTFLLYYLNLKIALRSIDSLPKEDAYLPPLLKLYRNIIVSRLPLKALNMLFILIGLGVASYTTYSLDTGWAIWLQFINRTPFEVIDPILGLDVGFYVFVLPVIQVVQTVFLPLLIWLLPVSITVYTVFNPTQLLGWRKPQLSFPQKHILIQTSTLLLLIALGFCIQALSLTLTTNALFLGANYTDIHVRLPGYLLGAVSLVSLSLIFFLGRWKWYPKIAFRAGLISLIVIFLSVWGTPSFVQRLMVEPNQYAKEKPYLEHHIGMTQKAYGLDNIEIRQFPADTTVNNLEKLEPTIENIRLWDWRPLQLSYNQLQALSYYYDFPSVDVDRYMIDNKIRQVMLAAREIDLNRFEPHVQTWTNTRLRYTHGYGIVMSPVDETTSNGLPNFIIKDIPPTTTGGLELTRPEIYFGELTHNYVITNTNIKEFNYPKGEDNDETIYQGKGGIPLNNYLKRLLFAARFKDYRLLISNELNSNSEVLYHREIVDRVQRIAPFLKLDDDPYIILQEGRLFWLLDAYTATNNYPYSATTLGWGNYARNSVKVVVDAYDGDVSFYLADKTDPLALTWQKAFPKLFRDLEEMPLGLQEHLRYPVDLFRIQAEIYAKYHMSNPLVFYNDEDAWRIPEEKYQSEIVSMDPYYTILQLNHQDDPEFILMLPFIPAKNISNMVAWMAAQNDPPNYGQMIVYKFFKDRHVYGPMQIESRIDQDSEISQQLTLWDQRGSRVIRGNLLVIPLDGAILYVEPIFIQSEQSSIPELSRVIVVFEDKVVMAKTLPEALEQALGRPTTSETAPETGDTIIREDLGFVELAQQAKDIYEQALIAQRAGDWAMYGTHLDKLEEILNQMIYPANDKEE